MDFNKLSSNLANTWLCLLKLLRGWLESGILKAVTAAGVVSAEAAVPV